MIRLIEIALAEVGEHEVGGENSGPRVRTYQAATWLRPSPWPWCAAFVSWCLRERLKEPGFVPYDDAKAKLGLPVDGWRFRSAAAHDVEVWGAQRGTVLTARAPAHFGDLVTFDFDGNGYADHCGIVVADNGDTVSVVEGNTSDPKGPRADERNGGCVALKVRPKRLVRRYVRLIP